ncbi:ABC transporter substrate-binding protein [Ruoffia tabacinasalis]|nr:ABC transporter substrate-binding protein [Ruoffia tabacinasalis]
MMKLRKIGLTLLSALLLSTTALSPAVTFAQENIIIGGNLELTGNAAAYGSPAADAINLFIQQINDNGGILDGRMLEAEIIDNRSDLTESASIATRLAGSEAVGIIGPTATGVAKAAIPITNEAGIANIFAATTGDGLTLAVDGSLLEYIFRVCFEDSYQGLAAGAYTANELGFSKAVILTDQSLDYSLALADSFTETFTENGGEILETQSYQSGDTDFTALLTSLLGKDFDVLYIPGYYTETGLIIKQAREMGITQPIIGGDGYHSDTLVDLAGTSNATDIYFTTHFSEESDNPKVQEFLTDFEEMYGRSADTFSALGYDAIGLLVDAIERAGSTDRDAIRQALEETENFEGITGTFSMDENHNPTKSALMLRLENGEIAEVSEASAEE